MIISHEKEMIFIHIPRTGGTIISKNICKKLGIEDWKSFIGEPKNISPSDHPMEPEGFERKMKNGYKHKNVKQIKKKVGEEVWSSYFKFSFVRNPWDRTLSMYLKQIKKTLPYFKNQIKKSKLLFNASLFTKYKLLKRETSQQVEYLRNKKGKIDVDFVGKYEKIEDDFNKVCSRVGIGPNLKGRHDSTGHEGYKKYYITKSKKIVENKNREDIEEFEYEF
jgi:hypothetical protein